MSTSLDLNILSVARYAGQEYPELLGLHVSEPPRRPARSRGKDRLVLYLAMVGNAPLPPGKRDQVLADLAKLYFSTAGSVTSALRVVLEELNRSLLERNRRISSSGRQGVGLFNQVVVRGEQLYLAQSGPAHAFLITADEVRHFHDPEMVDRGLGQSRTPPVCYYQASLQPGDTLLLSTQPSPDWSTTTLAGIHGQGPESMRRRLFNQADLDLNAVMIQARPGRGKFYMLRVPTPQAAPPVAERDQARDVKPVEPAPEPTISEAGLVSPATEPPGEGALPGDRVLSPPPQEGIPPLRQEKAVAPAIQPERGAPSPPAPDVEQPLPDLPARRGLDLSPVWKILVAIGTPIARFLLTLVTGVRTLLGRILPSEDFLALPSSVMAVIAVAVPVIIVAVASTTYFRLGRAAQYEVLYSQAEQMAVQAIAQTDLSAKRAGLEASLEILQQTESYRITPETQALRLQIRELLDDLELVKRVDYQPAIVGGLPPSVRVAQIVMSENELYLLDGNSGDVIRARMTSQGYEVDQDFQCSPNAPDASLTGSVVGIAAWPVGFKPQASVLALDNGGNVIYCQPNEPLETGKLVAPPSEAWGDIVASALDLGDFYVLDLSSNGVWVYWRSNFGEEPSMVFDQEIPNLSDVLDLAVDGDDLYLMHADGNLTLCNFSGFEGVPTRCSDPPYIDFRPGHENSPLVLPNPFTQILVTPPPDPSLFVLEPVSHGVYHFSLRNLAFQRQYLPEEPLSADDVTAFAVDTLHRTLFLAIGNEVYYGALP